MAERIQRQRTKGWRMPEGAVYVGRPTVWGNPWKIGDRVDAPFVWHVDSAARAVDGDRLVAITPEIARDLYRVYANEAGNLWMQKLRGRDLACWCPLDQPCHADVLLELANR